MVIGKKIKQMVLEFINMQMEHSMKVIGKKTFNMVKERNNGPTKTDMKVIILKAKNKEKENIFGVMAVAMMENGLIIKSMVMASIVGLTEEVIKV